MTTEPFVSLSTRIVCKTTEDYAIAYGTRYTGMMLGGLIFDEETIPDLETIKYIFFSTTESSSYLTSSELKLCIMKLRYFV